MVGNVYSLVPRVVHNRRWYYMKGPFRCQSHKCKLYLPIQIPISANNPEDEVARWWHCTRHCRAGYAQPVAITGNWLASPGHTCAQYDWPLSPTSVHAGPRPRYWVSHWRPIDDNSNGSVINNQREMVVKENNLCESMTWHVTRNDVECSEGKSESPSSASPP